MERAHTHSLMPGTLLIPTLKIQAIDRASKLVSGFTSKTRAGPSRSCIGRRFILDQGG